MNAGGNARQAVAVAEKGRVPDATRMSLCGAPSATPPSSRCSADRTPHEQHQHSARCGYEQTERHRD